MSKATARRALRQMTGQPVLISVEAVSAPNLETVSNQVLADLRELSLMGESRTQLAEMWEARKNGIAMDYWGDAAPVQSKPFAYSDGNAVIPVHGSLINRYSWSWSWATGYNFIRSQLDAANADPDVKRIILDVNSYGGTVAGCPETAEAVAKSGKPVLAMVDDSCFSAAYYVASQASRINVVPSGRAGSVGVVLMHMDVSKALEDYGIKVTLLHAGEHKVDGNPYEPLSDAVKAELQADIDACYDQFVATVAKGRKLDEKVVRDTEARCYRAEEALALGLIDAVSDMNTAVAQFTSGEECDPPLDDADQPEAKENAMPPVQPVATEGGAQPSAEAIAEAQKAGATAATARISAILTSPEAEGRSTLANHLAFNTDMSTETAVATMKVAAKEAVAEAPKPAPATGTAFDRAMATATHPGVDASDGTEKPAEPTEEKDGGKRILAAQRAAFGTREVRTPKLVH